MKKKKCITDENVNANNYIRNINGEKYWLNKLVFVYMSKSLTIITMFSFFLCHYITT